MSDDQPRKLTIVGKPENVQNAIKMIEAVKEGGPSMLADFPEVAGNVKATVDCPRTIVGRLIGKGGDIIRYVCAYSCLSLSRFAPLLGGPSFLFDFGSLRWEIFSTTLRSILRSTRICLQSSHTYSPSPSSLPPSLPPQQRDSIPF